MHRFRSSFLSMMRRPVTRSREEFPTPTHSQAFRKYRYRLSYLYYFCWWKATCWSIVYRWRGNERILGVFLSLLILVHITLELPLWTDGFLTHIKNQYNTVILYHMQDWWTVIGLCWIYRIQIINCWLWCIFSWYVDQNFLILFFLMHSLIIFDLDDTLAESKAQLQPNMADAMTRLLSHPFKVAIITGGKYEQIIKQVVSRIASKCKSWEFYIYFLLVEHHFYQFKNGTWINIYEEKLSSDDVKKIFTALKEAQLEANVITDWPLYWEQIEDRGTQVSWSALGHNVPRKSKLHGIQIRRSVFLCFHFFRKNFQNMRFESAELQQLISQEKESIRNMEFIRWKNISMFHFLICSSSEMLYFLVGMTMLQLKQGLIIERLRVQTWHERSYRVFSKIMK